MTHPSSNEMKRLFEQLSSKKDSDWKEKIEALFTSANTTEQLEKIGTFLTSEQSSHLVHFCSQEEKKWASKLLSVLVGLKESVFAKVLEKISKKDLDLLKHQALAEPILHQITQLTRKWIHDLDSKEKELLALEKKIEELPVLSLYYRDIERIEEIISSLAQFYEKIAETVSKALAISWNSNREDLIEKLTQIKKTVLRIKTEVIGHASQEERFPSGYYKKLEEKLYSAFGEDHFLYDEEPVMEAFSQFSLWYLEDYRKIGILSLKEDLKIKGSLSLESIDPSEREQLLQKMQLFLEEIGLRTIKDLKQRRICSKNTLIEYIQSSRGREEDAVTKT